MYSLSFKPYMHSTVAVGSMAMLLTLSDLICKRQIPCRNIHSLDIVIIATSWYLKKPAHLADWIFVFVTIDHHIFYACPHFLSVSERKSRNNSFSILNLAISASKPSDFEGQPFFLWENSFFCISLLAIIATEKLMYLLRCNTYFVCYLFSRAAFWF